MALPPKDKVQFVNPAFTEDRGSEQTAQDHKAGKWLYREIWAQVFDIQIPESCTVHPPPPPTSVLLLCGLITQERDQKCENSSKMSWENHRSGTLRFQSPPLPGSPSVSEGNGAGRGGINSFCAP